MSTNTSKVNLSKLLLYKGSLPLVIIVVICLLISAFLGAINPRLIKDLSINYGSEAFYDTIRSLIYLFMGIYVNRVIYQITINKYVQYLVLNTRSESYEKWLLSYDIQTSKDMVSERYPQGEVISRVINDTESVRELITSGTFGIFIDSFFVISNIISFITINQKLGSMLAIFIIGCSIVLFWGSKYMRSVFLAVRTSRGYVQRTLANLIGGVGETYYTNHGGYAEKKGEIVFDDFLKKILRSNVWDAGYYSLAESLYPVMLLFVVLVFPYSGITEAAIVLVIVDLIQKSINPVKDIASKIANVQRAASGITRINEFLADLAKSKSSPKDFEFKDIDFEKLHVKVKHFEYPTQKDDEKKRFSLSGIDFQESKGKLLGVVGLSGCGKSTLLNILAGNIVPDDFQIEIFHGEGVICYGDKALDQSIKYREHVGIVSQDSHIFSESLQFNISMGKKSQKEFDDFWIWIKEQIPYLELWGVTPDEKLVQNELSVGQKQLIAAIRSCFLKKKIVLFDEVSSGLDSELELALRKAINLIQTHSLTIVVAHRLETIVESDLIMVMDDGKIIDSGSHDVLIKSSKIYQKFIAELGH